MLRQRNATPITNPFSIFDVEKAWDMDDIVMLRFIAVTSLGAKVKLDGFFIASCPYYRGSIEMSTFFIKKFEPREIFLL